MSRKRYVWLNIELLTLRTDSNEIAQIRSDKASNFNCASLIVTGGNDSANKLCVKGVVQGGANLAAANLAAKRDKKLN